MWTETAGADNAVTGDATAAQQCPLGGEALSLVTLSPVILPLSISLSPAKALVALDSASLEALSLHFSQLMLSFLSISPAEAFLNFYLLLPAHVHMLQPPHLSPHLPPSLLFIPLLFCCAARALCVDGGGPAMC